jgi:hypothetical protein
MLAILATIVAQGHPGEGVLPEGLHVKGHGECNPLDMSTWCQMRGIGAVTLALAIFVGLPIVILGTNVGFRKGSAVMCGALLAYLTIHGFLWMIYPRGPVVVRKVAGLPMAISSRMPAILLMLGAGSLFALTCLLLNRIDRPQVEEPTLTE